MNSDFLDLLKLLDQWNVQFVVIGAYAVMEHTEPRATKDLDLLVACSKKNAPLVSKALKDFGAPLQGISPDFFATRGNFYKIGRPPNRIDIITSAEGAPFSSVWKNRVSRKIASIDVPFASIEDLIAMKKAAGRPQDILDIEKLKIAKKIGKIKRK